jgi:C4-dicarboxylate-specific signal transduction histidine kinase
VAVCRTPAVRRLAGGASTVVNFSAADQTRLVIVGATGMVGGYALRYALGHPDIAISANSSAARRFLGKTPPDVQEARGCLIRIVDGVRQTSEILDGIRSLFRRAEQVREQIDVNEITLEVLKPMGAELKDRITIRSELTTRVPLVDGNKRQLQEVIVNLVRNAMEAMDDTTDRNRVLLVKTEQRSGDAIVLSVQDTGPGIDPKNLESIFDAFVTTKSGGMGLGLAISRMIVEQHGGQLTASSDGKNGALFQLVLPAAATDKTPFAVTHKAMKKVSRRVPKRSLAGA